MRRLAFVLLLLGCSEPHAPHAAAPEPMTPTVRNPPPAALAETAAKFGLEMSGDFVWTKISREETRFDWSGHPAGRDDVEVLWSFWMEKMDATSVKFLPNLTMAAAADLTQDPHASPEPFDQPEDIVHAFGYDRVLTACFVPFEGYGKGKKQGVMHAIVKRGALSVVAIFSNDRTGLVPLPKDIGARGR